jgi:hypothetical protein
VLLENAPSPVSLLRHLTIIFFFSFLKKKLAPPFFPVVRCLLTINGHNRNRKLASRLKCLRWCGCVCRGENHRCLKNEKKNKTEKRYPEREREQEKGKKKRQAQPETISPKERMRNETKKKKKGRRPLKRKEKKKR